MTEWWTVHQGTLVGALGGAGLGLGAGIYGAAVGMLAPKGIGRRVLIPVHIALVVLGVVALIAGIAAAIQRQPYHVFYPLLLIGAVLTFVMVGLLPVVLMRYRQAEGRKMDAELLRKG